MTEAEQDGLDKISFEIGRHTEGLKNLKEVFQQHESEDDKRHQENVKVLQEIRDALAPISASYRLTKRRLAFVASFGFMLLVGLSWALEAALKWAIGWLLKVKFGGP